MTWMVSRVAWMLRSMVSRRKNKSRHGRFGGRSDKVLQEMIHTGENLLHETHEENKRNMNYYFRDFDVWFNTHHIPNIDMRKFDGKDLVTWILQMEQCFDLNNVQNTQKVCMETLYLEPNQFV